MDESASLLNPDGPASLNPDGAASPAGRGTSQTGVRLYNERLILSLIRRHRALTKVDIARLTGLSTQTTTVIMNRLQADGLLLAGERKKGRIGQPSVPFSLNPDGAFGIGMMIGRRSSELILMDFVAGIRARDRITYAHPDPDQLMAFAEAAIPGLIGRLDDDQRGRITGLGVAMPFELWNWEADLETPPGALGVWRTFDVRRALSARFPDWPVRVANDATSACAAELTFGRGEAFRDFAYLYVGTFIGGGIVLNGTLYPGRSGNAGALGSMPILKRDAAGHASVQQLIRTASIYRLERRLIAAGLDGTAIWRAPHDWSSFDPHLERWIDEAADGLAQAIAAILSVIDFEAIVIDGAFPPSVRARLVERTRERLRGIDLQGLTEAAIVEGSVGRDARAVGGAALPLLSTFARDLDVLFKD